jgi:hypothetical protein
MELRFVVGVIIVAIGFALMLPEKNVVQDVVQDKKIYDSPIKVQEQQREPDTARGYARSMVSEIEYEALHELIDRESLGIVTHRTLSLRRMGWHNFWTKLGTWLVLRSLLIIVFNLSLHKNMLL